MLLKVSDASGKLTMTEMARGEKIRRDSLNSNDVFILDDGFEVMVWVGKGASREERKQGLNMAAKYLQQAGLPADTPISSCMEGGENEVGLDMRKYIFFTTLRTYIHTYIHRFIHLASPSDGSSGIERLHRPRGFEFNC